MPQQKLFALLPLLLFALSPPIAAQLQTNSGGSQGSSGSSGIQNQSENTVDTFLDVQVQVTRLIRMPSQDGVIRVILKIVEGDTAGRRVALIKPQPTLLDDVGNVYGLVDSTGVRECSRKKGLWEYGTKYCMGYAPDAPVKMTPTQPIVAVLTFAPSETGYSAELASYAKNATLQARFGLFSDDNKTQNFADVIINGIEIPDAGS